MQMGDGKLGQKLRHFFVASGDANPLGGANAEDIAKAVIDSVGEGVELDAPDFGIAMQAISRGIGSRLRNASYDQDPSSLAVFILTDRPRSIARSLGATKEPIINNGAVALNGNIWITGPNFQSAHRISIKSTSNGDIFKEINTLGLGDNEAFVFDPNGSESELRHYPKGCDEMDIVSRFLIAKTDFSIETLDEVLTRFHEGSVRVPDVILNKDLSPWKQSEKYIPRPRAEEFIQTLLRWYILACFHKPFDCVFEMPGSQGRCDLMLVSKNIDGPNTWEYHAVLELKILRSKTSGGKSKPKTDTAQAVEKGVNQAIAYKTTTCANYGMLCSYDMREVSDGESCYDAVRDVATTNCIELRHYRLFGSSEDFRTSVYGQASS